MKKLLLILFMIMLSTVSLLSTPCDISVATNNQFLEARSVLFLDSGSLYYPSSTGYKVLELKDSSEKNELITARFNNDNRKLHDALNSAKNEEKEKIYLKIEALKQAYHNQLNDFGEIRDRVCKRITELSREYAIESGACAVRDLKVNFHLYVDPSYDITDKVLARLNKEYLDKLGILC